MTGHWEYLDLDLTIDRSDAPAGQGVGYRARVVGSPAGVASGTFVFPFSAAELDLFRMTVGPPRVSSRRLLPRAAPVHTAKAYGARLFDALFAGDVATCFSASLRDAQSQDKGLRVRLDLTDAPVLDNVPWEYLYASSMGRFLAMSAQTPVVRYFRTPFPTRTLRVQPPLRVLVMISSPSDTPDLQADKEEALLRANTADLVKAGLLDVVVEREATVANLQRHLSYDQFHAFHFIGHGAFDESVAEGVLCFQEPDGTAQRVKGSYVGTLLHDARSMQLAVLNACEGARTSGQDTWSGVGQSLVRQGLPAVIAMQAEISDRAALAFSHEFYYALSRGFPLDAAAAEARKAIGGAEDDAEWGTPVLLQSATEQPFELITTAHPELGPEVRRQELHDAAAAAVAAGSAIVAAPLLAQLKRERPGDRDVTELIARMDANTAARPPGPGSAITQASTGAAAAAAGATVLAGRPGPTERSPSPSGPPTWWKSVGARVAMAAFGGALALALVLVVVLLVRQGPGALSQGTTGATPGLSNPSGVPLVTAPILTTPSSPSGGTPTGGTPSGSTPTAGTGVVYQGQARLDDPTMNLDLTTGGLTSLFSFQGHIGWTGSSLLIYDETTLGAVVLPRAQFDRVSAQQLVAAAYQRGAANPAMSRADLPVGAVLAVRVDTAVYAKLTVLAYGSRGDIQLRWVTYRTT